MNNATEMRIGMQIKYLLKELESHHLTDEYPATLDELKGLRNALKRRRDEAQANDAEAFARFSEELTLWIRSIDDRIVGYHGHLPYVEWLAAHGGNAAEAEAVVMLPQNGGAYLPAYFGDDPVYVTEQPIYRYLDGEADGLVNGDIYGVFMPTRSSKRAFLVLDKYGIQLYALMYESDVVVDGDKYTRFPAANWEERNAIRQYLRTDDNPEALRGN